MTTAAGSLSFTTRRTALARFAGTLQSESHVLALTPELTWQQLFNRLQWDQEVLERLQPALARRSVAGSPPWLRSLTPVRESSSLLRTLAGHQGDVSVCAFSPDGARLASATSTGQMRLWEVDTGKMLWSIQAHTFPIRACTFDPAGRQLVSASNDGTLKLWSATNGEELGKLSGHAQPVLACAFTADGTGVVSAGADLTLRTWRVGDATQSSSVEVDSAWYVDACAFDPSGDRVLWASAERELGIRQVRSGAWAPAFQSQKGHCCAAAFSLDGQQVATAQTDGTIFTWNASTGEVLGALKGHDGFVWCCAYDARRRHIVSAGADGTVRIWDAASGLELIRFGGHAGWALSCAFSPDDRRVASGGRDGSVKVWDAAIGAEGNVRAAHSPKVETLAFHPQGTLLISASGQRDLSIWDAEQGNLISTLHGHVQRVVSCAFGDGGTCVVSAAADGTFKVWDLASAREHFSSRWEDLRNLSVCEFSPNGQRVAVSKGDLVLEIRDLVTGRLLHALRGHEGSINACAFGPDGRRIASAAQDGTLRIWDVERGEETRCLAGHTSWVLSVAFSPEGDRVVSGSVDGDVLIWDVASGKKSGLLRGHSDWVWACCFSPDGRWVISGSADKSLRIWDPRSARTLAVVPLSGTVQWLAHHPVRPILAAASGGWLHLFQAIGIPLGPPVLTAVDRGGRSSAQCPSCGQSLPAGAGVRGTTVRCSAPSCGQQYRLTDLIVSQSPPRFGPPLWEEIWPAPIDDSIQRPSTAQGAIPPVLKKLEVVIPLEDAFRRFTLEIGSWWPLDSVSVGQRNTQTCVLEGRPGGRIYEVHTDGTEVDWGTVDAWEPPARIRCSWHAGVPPEQAQRLAVSFEAADAGTRVELEHTGWEALGDMAREGRDAYQRGWDLILEKYARGL